MDSKKIMALVLLAGVGLWAAPEGAEARREGRYDQQVQTLVTDELQKRYNFRGISAEVEDGIVTLSGNVDLYIDKMNAEKKVRKVKNVDGVRNHVEVRGKDVPDAELREILANRLRYDRVGYGIVFNSLTVAVDKGAVTVAGQVRDYPDRDSALAIVETTQGVKDVIDEIDVAPVSWFDDNLRVSLAHTIYTTPTLQKYASDPQAPIRIAVKNGNVELHGVVLNDADRQMAYMQARSVPGVFSVKNELIVAPAGVK